MIISRALALLGGLFFFILNEPAPCLAASDRTVVGKLEITQAWARATPPSAKNGVAFMVISNHGMSADKLTALNSKASGKTELHSHINENGIMRMRRIKHIHIPGHGQAILKPGSYHVMFIGLKTPFKEGDTVMVKLRFEKAGEILLHMPIKKGGAMAKGDVKIKHKHN